MTHDTTTNNIHTKNDTNSNTYNNNDNDNKAGQLESTTTLLLAE